MAASDAFYNDLIPEIEAVFADYGTTFTVEKPGSYNDQTMTTTPAGPARQVAGVVSDNTIASSLTNLATIALKSSKSLLMPPSAAFEVGESVVVEGVRYPVSNIKTVKPADVIVLYILELDR